MRYEFCPARRRVLQGLIATFAAIGVLIGGDPLPAHAASSAQSAGYDTGTALVQLAADPLATATSTRPPRGRKIDFDSTTVKSYRAQLAAQRNDYKAWLRQNVPAAKVTGEFDISLNAVSVQLNGATLAQVSATPLVNYAEYQGVYHPVAADPDLSLIRAEQAWSQGGGAATAGAGVKVAIIDTGIDISNPCFSDAGYPATTQLGDHSFTNNKVIVAKVFNNKTPVAHYTPEALQSHGTHVAGTVACNNGTPATVDGIAIPYAISGVAPRALLGNYNVFPGAVEDARSEDILNALEAAYSDGFDVANMSLGGGSHGVQDLVAVAIDDLDRANMVVAVAAGNSGPGNFTVESPGFAALALTAGASTVGHFVGKPLTVGSATYALRTGDFAVATTDLTAPLGAVLNSDSTLSLGCTALPAGSLTGKIALIKRGTCLFSEKIRNAQAAGAVAAVIVNSRPGDPIPMGTDGLPSQPTIPAYMVGLAHQGALVAANGASATIGAASQYFDTDNDDIMADFSSQGPTDVDFRVKPDVVAPGVSVLSSFPSSACATPPCFAFLNGTSMATPHLAGSAAVVRGQHPLWSAADVRSAVVNTAVRGVLRNFLTGNLEGDVNVTGSGREDLLNAVRAAVLVDPVSVSFGAVPSGSGQSRTIAVTVRATDAPASLSFTISPTGDTGVTYSVSPASAAVAANGSVTVNVTMTSLKRAALGSHAAWLNISSGGAEVAHAALYTLVK